MKTDYKVSVALCTYNGEKYIREQLDSILSQSLLPDEIVICDDCSSDNTVEIIREYAKNNDCIRLYENKVNLGYKANFAKAINLCSGDYIFLCDQDDVWAQDKIKQMVDAFSHNNDKDLISSKVDLIDDKGKLINPFFKKSFLKKINNSKAQWKLIIIKPRFPGMCFAIRKTLLEKCNPFPSIYHHDEWLSTISSLSNGIIVLDETLSFYRQHQSQTIGLNSDFEKSKSENKIAFNEVNKTECLLEYCNEKRILEPTKLIEKKNSFYKFRVKQRERNCFISFFVALFRLDMFCLYCRFCSKPLLSVGKDVIMHKGGNK